VKRRETETMAKKQTPEAKVEAILAKIRPYVQMHGGDVQLLNITDGTATFKIYGACVGCSLSYMTYDTMVGGIIKKDVPEVKNVVFEQ
jgi:Fe-S cluster biogenesis protein NfuA